MVDQQVRSPFVGRRAEVQQLEDCLQRVEKGASQVVVIAGEPGIGKTRLALEFLDMVAERGVARSLGRSFAEGTLPYGAILECVAQLRAQGAGPVSRSLTGVLASTRETASALRLRLRLSRDERDPAEAKARLHEALATLVADWSRVRPVILLLDDLHWADPGSLDVLRSLGRRLVPTLVGSGARVLVLATARSPEAEQGPLAALLRELDHDHVLVRMRVERLVETDVRGLVRTLLPDSTPQGFADSVVERSQGNPYYVEELCRDLEERRALRGPSVTTAHESPEDRSVPEQLKRLLEARLERLSEAGLAALRVAALLGSDFRYDVLQQACELDDERALACAEEALAAQVLRAVPDSRPLRFEFRHVLVSEALREGLSDPRRQRLHVRIAQVLERIAPDQASEIARHLLAARELAPDERVARWCEAAGEHAARLHAPAEAARLLGEALAARERMGGANSIEAEKLRLGLFPVMAQAGGMDPARALALRAIESLEARADWAAADQARLTLARLLRHHAQPGESLRVLEPALRRSTERREPSGALLAEAAVALDLTGEAAGMRQTAARLLRIARRARDSALEEQALTVERNWWANHSVRLARALSLSRRLLASARRRSDPWDEAVFGSDVGTFELITGRVGEALLTLDDALERALRTGAVSAVINMHAVRATCFCFRGEWDRVDQEWERAAPLLGRVTRTLRLGMLLFARIRSDVWRGRPGPPLPADPDRLYADIAQFQIDALAATGLVAAEQRAPVAAELLRRAGERQDLSGSGVNWLTATQAIAAGWTALGAAGEAARWYEPLAPYRGTLLLGCTDLILGQGARLAGRLDAAGRDLARAARHARRERLRPFLALALREQALLARDRGSIAGANTLARRAERLAAELGMKLPPAEFSAA
jgi:hypothetical protein